MLGSSSRKIRKASGIHVNSCPVRKPMVKHGLAGWATRRALQLPLPPAIALSGRDRERLDPLVSVRYPGLFASRVGHRPRPQGLESADSTRVAMCAAFAVPPPSGFPRRQPRRNNEDVVIPFPLPDR